MKKRLLPLILLLTLGFAACSENEDEYDPYTNWPARNDQWFATITDSARTAIAEAKAQWGDRWEEHCEWRQYKSLLKSQDYDSGRYTDSICVHILQRGEGTYSPTFSDTVRLNLRGWLMPATYKRYNADRVEVDSVLQKVFTENYSGAYNPAMAAPSLMAVGSTIEGFSTALQYMVEGDDWLVYIPQNLAYGNSASAAIPAYSTLQFRLSMVAVYPSGSGVPAWKVRPRNP